MANPNSTAQAPTGSSASTNAPAPTNQESVNLTIFIGGKIKNALQTVIAVSIVGILILKVLFVVQWDVFGVLSADWFVHIKPIFMELKTLEIVAKALAYSAGIDLAYMLLTPGPDEAIEPLILGLASAILFSISSIGDENIRLALEIGLYVIILAGLFVLKALFIKDDPFQYTHTLISLLKIKVKNVLEDIKDLFKL